MIEKDEIKERLYSLNYYSCEILRDYNSIRIQKYMELQSKKILTKVIKVLESDSIDFNDSLTKLIIEGNYQLIDDIDSGLVFNKRLLTECLILSIYEEDDKALDMLEEYHKVNKAEITRRDSFQKARKAIATKDITRKLSLKR